MSESSKITPSVWMSMTGVCIFSAAVALIGMTAASALMAVTISCLLVWRMFSGSTCAMDMLAGVFYFLLATGMLAFYQHASGHPILG